MIDLPPTSTSELLLPLHNLLIALLRGLDASDWDAPTVAGSWRVRDIAAHLLDGDLRRLSMQRDGRALPPAEPIDGYRDLVRFLDQLNHDWVQAARRLSPRVLIELLELSGPATAALLASLPPHGPAFFPVAWAGEDRSEHWMDVGREYTERWHHQIQIRDAVRAAHPDASATLLDRQWLEPLLESSLRAVPHAYRTMPASEGDAIVIELVTDEGLSWSAAWSLVGSGGGWHIGRGVAAMPRARVRLDAESCWRLFYNAPQRAGNGYPIVDGDEVLAAPLLRARSVMV